MTDMDMKKTRPTLGQLIGEPKEKRDQMIRDANIHCADQSGSQSSAKMIIKMLKDRNVVHANMLRGTIAMPCDAQIKHLYPHLFENIDMNHVEEGMKNE